MTGLESFIRTVPDFPTPGILFRDLTPLMADAGALKESVERLVAPFRALDVELVAGMEARGFIFGALAAQVLGTGFVPLRKAGKLPAEVEAVTYALEYGTATLEVRRGSFTSGARMLIVDDVLATGGTAAASAELLERMGAKVVGLGFVLELEALAGRKRLGGRRVESVLRL